MDTSYEEKLYKSVSNIDTTLKSIKDCLEKQSNRKDFVVYKSSCKKIISIIVLCIFTIFSGINLGIHCFNYQRMNDRNCSDIKVTFQQIMAEQSPNNSISTKINTESKTGLGLNHVIMIGNIVLLCIVVFYLSYLIARDNDDIKFAKLNELHDLKMNILKDIPVSNEIQDYEIIEDKAKKQGAEKIITKKKNLNAEIIKHYMNSITEI